MMKNVFTSNGFKCYQVNGAPAAAAKVVRQALELPIRL